MVEEWSSQVVAASESSQNENMRTAAAQALTLAGLAVMNYSAQTRDVCLEKSVTK